MTRYIRVDEKGILTLEWDFLKILAKRTGLRSKKKRHVKKRAKKIIHLLLEDAVKKETT